MLQRHTYDKAIDIWVRSSTPNSLTPFPFCVCPQALGIIVFVLLCGCLPFDDDSSRITSDVVARKKFALRFPRWANNLSASAKDLLQRLLDVDPKTRITAQEAEKHPWVRGEVAPDNYLTSPSILGMTIISSFLPPLSSGSCHNNRRAKEGAEVSHHTAHASHA
jgi:serine/threonine protein kinase